jgi:hypothetical protein
MSSKKSPSPNFLTCPVPGMDEMLESEKSVKAPMPANVPVEPKAKEVSFFSTKTKSKPTPAPSTVHSTPLERAMPRVDPRDERDARLPRRRHPVRWVIVLALIVAAVLTGPAVYALVRAGVAAQAAKDAVKRAAVQAQRGNVTQATQELAGARDGLNDARDALKGVGFWRDIPGVGTQVRALEDAASAGASTLDAAQELSAVADGLLDAASTASAATGELLNPVEAHRSFNDLTPEEKRAILARLDRSLPDIRAAQAKIAVALDTWNRIPQGKLYAPLREALAPVATSLPQLKKTLDEAVPLLDVFLPLAGYPKSAEYLVLLQNSDEIRATGGFIGTWGILKVDGGDLKDFSFHDVYSLDNPASGNWKEVPPAPIKDRLGVPAWFFRDANWSPDFPTSAQRMSDFYVRETKQGTGKDVKVPDGVIALNAPFFQGLLGITGPITVDGVTFNANNFFDQIEVEVEQNFLQQGIPQDQRKQILLKLGDALMAKIMSLPAARWPDLLDLTTRSLDHKQIQVFARDPATLKQLDVFAWTGRTKPTNGDFVWVIDSNLAALKTDGVMTKEVHYHLDATDPNGPLATVTLRYTNNGPGINKDYRYTRYRDYVRVYVPDGAQLVSTKGAMKDDRYRTGGRFVSGPTDVMHELGKTVFGAFWSIEPKTTQELSFTYRLPPTMLMSSDPDAKPGYHLDIPKQSGNDESSLTLDLRFGKNLKTAMPPEASEQFGDMSYKVESDTALDRSFQVSF